VKPNCIKRDAKYEGREGSGDVYENLKKMRKEKNELVSELKEVRVQQIATDFKQSQKDYESNEDQILKLENQKLRILVAAEIMTLKERDEQRKIKAANSLIHCLERVNPNDNESPL
jgi:predicted patatin/cPLA2 family phospholipase